MNVDKSLYRHDFAYALASEYVFTGNNGEINKPRV